MREEAKWLSSRLRFEDRQEVETVRGSSRIDLSDCLDISDETYSIRFSDEHGKPEKHPVVLFGVGHSPDDSTQGIPWLLAADGVSRGAIALLREARYWLDAWCLKYPKGLHNIVDERNQLHVRWLRHAGCIFDAVVDVRGYQFLHFHKE